MSDLSRKYSGESPDEVLEWRIEYINMRRQSAYENYHAWPDLYLVFDHIWNVCELSIPGYPDTFITFKVRVAKNSEYENFKRELAKILKHITYRDKDCNPIILIFDRFLSEHGNSVRLVITGEDTAKVVGRWTHVEGSLRECFDYLCRERYYE